MPEPKSPNSIAPWHVPVAVEDIAEAGQHFDLVADATVRAAVAKVAGLRDLPRFEANFDVVRRGSGGLHVTGSISATVGQACVVTLEPLASEVEETIDLIFEPQTITQSASSERQRHSLDLKGPDPLVGGMVDLGALATEFLILGIDPYPRKPDAVFEAPQQGTGDQGPFAALERLAKRQEGG
jgi:Large ribosomal RNA subunit accumulation protein YceD